MALRLIEIVLPDAKSREVKELLEEHSTLGLWQQKLSEHETLTRLLLQADKTEQVLDLLEKQFSTTAGFRVVLLRVEASVPRIEEPEERPPAGEKPPEEKKSEPEVAGVSRHEIYTDIADGTRSSRQFVVLVALSTIVAAVGILRDNVAIIIGAMVIAPVLGPSVALSLATTLGDIELTQRALRAIVVATFTALALSMLMGFILPVNPAGAELLSRTRVGFGDIALALASGSAGALSFRQGIPTALIGVMVAVALLPPLVAFGLLLGSGYLALALAAMLLFLTNLICINLAGVTTFFLQGIGPRTWWEKDRARKAIRRAIAFWIVLLLALVVVILLSQRG